MKICRIEGCCNKSRAMSLCQKHYDRLHRTGSVELIPAEPAILSDVFMKYVRKEKDCWIWTGAQTKGYGKFRMKDKNVISSRASWLLFREVPDNFASLLVCHRCDNPMCVNPDHLFLGTVQDNVDDKMKKGRHKSLKGTEQKSAKLDEEKVKFIRERSLTGPQLAKMFNVSLGLIKDIRSGKRWKHVI